MNKTRFLNPTISILLSSCITIYLAIDLYLAVQVISFFFFYIIDLYTLQLLFLLLIYFSGINSKSGITG